ncbi:NYN domain-containing protein [Actinacidiphila yanglinensis]|uniref:NYN domain-containing protein n=1 Tax=Actinacidiphila yanglinensis TaxID=310779 RepID=A0A1H6DIX7_9ACTN|nr:NYN domain-containing protein [Actinacidiphila yanglinensis]SEG85200.1 NYN domain-containing protein [Actinacidiphila yanglinensis]SEG91002.1 NYN domain-containing protein [Actinacidiphila yanglinensis]
MLTNIYIDGFNLYYGRLKGQKGSKWLDPVELCRNLLPAGTRIQRVRYFTARITPRPDDPDGPARQDAYLRALETLPEVSIHYGRFSQTKTRMRLASPPVGGPNTVEVIKTEEKGTDVHIGAHMLLDAFRKDCDMAVLISNDSDLCEPLRMVKSELGLTIGILNPFAQPSHWLKKLQPAFIKPIRQGVVRASQLPASVPLGDGKVVTQPQEWV